MSAGPDCPSSKDLMWAYVQGTTNSLREHLARCPHCCEELEKINEMMDMGKQVPYDLPSEDRLQDVRLGIYTGAMAQKANRGSGRKYARGAMLSAVMLLAVVVIALLWVAISGQNNPGVTALYRATVLPEGMATFEIESPQPAEIVRLVNGTIQVVVEPLQKGERFRVLVGDATIEVRGTVFRVVAKDNRLISVHVLSGRVALSRDITSTVELGPDQRWGEQQIITADSGPVRTEAPVVTQVKKTAPKPRTTAIASKPAAPIATPSPVFEKSEAQKGFQAGWAALKSRNYPQAIQSFEYALKQNGGDSIAEDAAFWLAVSYSYSGRKTDAEKAYASFLRGFPASARVGEASVALGWVLFERGDLTGAGALFSTAKNDRVTKVRESALKGLEAIEYRSAPAKPSVQ